MTNLSATQWLNLGVFALGSLAMAGWWQELLAPQYAAAASGGLIWASSLLNFALTGKATPAVVAAAPTAPPAA
jgi:hypothetical protein